MKKTIYILIACVMCGMTQIANAKRPNAHAEAHRHQLAAARSIGLDRTTITKMVEEDIATRENAKVTISAATDELLNDLLSEARSHLGKRYSSGSKGPNAFDCSGFAGYVYRQFGYALGASSGDQYQQGEKVDRKDLRKGDLVFFKGRSTKGGVGHVGIVVDADENGNFSFIHAATSKGITVSNCNEPYYAARFVGGKRVIND